MRLTGRIFRFSDYFPVSAAQLGADVVINSVHKTLPCLTQTGVIHLCSDRVSREKLKRFLGIYQSSSPSYILMSSIDACMDKLERILRLHLHFQMKLTPEDLMQLPAVQRTVHSSKQYLRCFVLLLKSSTAVNR